MLTTYAVALAKIDKYTKPFIRLKWQMNFRTNTNVVSNTFI